MAQLLRAISRSKVAQQKYSPANVGFSCKDDWRGPGSARDMTNGFVGWRLLLYGLLVFFGVLP
jgi:hypothetical protein